MAVSEPSIGLNTFVTVAFSVYDDGGDLVDRSAEDSPLSYLHGHGQMVPGLERALEGLTKGQTCSVVVPPALGYGEYDPDGVLEVDRSDFPHQGELTVGDEFLAQSPSGDELALTVLDVRTDAVVIDTNHPFAGETLRFEVKVLDVRPATSAEVRKAETIASGRIDLATLGRNPGNSSLLS